MHDIFKRDTSGDSDRDVERVVQQHFTRTVFIVATHNDHYHVLHDCTYHSYQCRSVPESITGQPIDAIEKLFQQGPTQQSTGEIQQTICIKANEQLSTARSPGKPVYDVVKLDLYPFKAIRNKEKKDFWKEVRIRTQFNISSIADPLHRKIEKIIQIVAARTNETEKVIEEKETRDFVYTYNKSHPLLQQYHYYNTIFSGVSLKSCLIFKKKRNFGLEIN